MTKVHDKQLMRTLYLSGEAVKEIAFQVGCAVSSVSPLCRRMGCPPRKRGRPFGVRVLANENGVEQ